MPEQTPPGDGPVFDTALSRETLCRMAALDERELLLCIKDCLATLTRLQMVLKVVRELKHLAMRSFNDAESAEQNTGPDAVVQSPMLTATSLLTTVPAQWEGHIDA